MKIFHILIFCVLIFAVPVSSNNSKEEHPRFARIINNDEKADLREFPYFVSYKMDNRFVCGGALISPQHILTAAHCIYNQGYHANNRFSVEVGSVQKGTGKVYHGLKRIAIPRNFCAYYTPIFLPNDIAIIHVSILCK